MWETIRTALLTFPQIYTNYNPKKYFFPNFYNYLGGGGGEGGGGGGGEGLLYGGLVGFLGELWAGGWLSDADVVGKVVEKLWAGLAGLRGRYVVNVHVCIFFLLLFFFSFLFPYLHFFHLFASLFP